MPTELPALSWVTVCLFCVCHPLVPQRQRQSGKNANATAAPLNYYYTRIYWDGRRRKPIQVEKRTIKHTHSTHDDFVYIPFISFIHMEKWQGYLGILHTNLEHNFNAGANLRNTSNDGQSRIGKVLVLLLVVVVDSRCVCFILLFFLFSFHCILQRRWNVEIVRFGQKLHTSSWWINHKICNTCNVWSDTKADE